MTIKEFIWMAGILIAVGGTWGMTSQRITAMEKDIDCNYFIHKNGIKNCCNRNRGQAHQREA